MSARSFLYPADGASFEPNANEGRFLLSANHFIPVLWLALYQGKDLLSTPNEEPGEPDELYLSAERSAAVGRLLERRDHLLQALPAGSDVVYEAFATFLQRVDCAHIQCDPRQSLMIGEPPMGHQTVLQKVLEGFDAHPFITVRRRKLFRKVEMQAPNEGWQAYHGWYMNPQSAMKRDPLPYVLAGCGEVERAPWDPDDV
jgi:hypothetical protein